MTLTADQRMAVEAPGSVAVTAGAGAGKTHMLAARYVHHLTAHGLDPLSVVAVTFTEKAAAELRARIREVVRETLPDRSDTLAELEAAPISTLHALCARICREHPEAAGAPADFALLDDLEGQLWRLTQLDLALDDMPPPAGEPIPFSLLKTTIALLLNDPVAAESALAVSPDSWEDLFIARQEEALTDFLTALGPHAEGLEAYSGQGPVDAQRQFVIQAFAELHDGADASEVLGELAALDGRTRGKAGDWPSGGLDQVREALKAVREGARAAVKDGLATLAWRPADDRLAAMLPTLRAAYAVVRDRLAAAKRQARVLDFADLEVHALQALDHADVQAYYHVRWQAFLVDEFQDTNPVQAALLARLTDGAKLTIVGDEQQAIYGFRRADAAVFRRLAADIIARGGAEVSLHTSFRTHAELVSDVNRFFRPVLGEGFAPLLAHRHTAPHAGPHLVAAAVEKPRNALVGPCRRVETAYVAETIQAMLATGLPVHDKATGTLRPLRPGDIAILARTWAPLDAFAEALEACGVPVVHAGGGDLLATREALDALALLRVLANPHDDVALVAVLRGPFFAVSDADLFRFAQTSGREAWWVRLKTQPPAELAYAVATLKELLAARRFEPSNRLLQLADRLCGYTAVVANLPGAARRLADWTGFADMVRGLTKSGADADAVVSLLSKLQAAEIEVPRPALESGDAVALMTVHAAKGLEWPVVIVPDNARSAPADTQQVRLDAALGVAFKWEDDAGEPMVPGLFQLIKARETARREDETHRVSYVALTRARDRLLLTAAAPSGGGLDALLPGLTAAGVKLLTIPYDADAALPPHRPDPAVRALPGSLLLGPVGAGPIAAVRRGRVVYRRTAAHPV